MANLSRETHPVEAVGNIGTPVTQARGLPVDKAGGIDFNARKCSKVKLQTTIPPVAEERTERSLSSNQQ